jgi:hypothetical protein
MVYTDLMFFWAIISKRMRLAGHIVRVVNRNAYGVMAGKPEGKKTTWKT